MSDIFRHYCDDSGLPHVDLSEFSKAKIDSCFRRDREASIVVKIRDLRSLYSFLVRSVLSQMRAYGASMSDTLRIISAAKAFYLPEIRELAPTTDLVDWSKHALYIKPYYKELHEQIISRIPLAADSELSVLDVGGACGPMARTILERFPRVALIIADKDRAELGHRANELAQWSQRVAFHCVDFRKQGNWPKAIGRSVDVVLSTLTIDCLEPSQKRRFFQLSNSALNPGGVIVLGEEVSLPDRREYRKALDSYADFPFVALEQSNLPLSALDLCLQWDQEATIFDAFPDARSCFPETVQAYKEYLCESGFTKIDSPWQKSLWAIIVAQKPSKMTRPSFTPR